MEEQINNWVGEISCGPEAYLEEGLNRLGVDTFFDPRGSGAHCCEETPRTSLSYLQTLALPCTRCVPGFGVSAVFAGFTGT